MPDFLRQIISKVNEFFGKMEKRQRGRFITLVSVMIIVIIVAAFFLNQTSYSVLYSGMEPQDAGEVLAVLKEMNVDAKTQGSDTILVASKSVDEVRMELASEGYPSSGFNYDIFANASGLGTTDMEKQVYLQFQLQENIRKTLIKMSKVKDAVVNINLPEESSFVLSDDNKPASAAVMLTLEDGQKLSDSEVRAIAELVSKSVSGLNLDDVRIIDSEMNLYEIKDGNEINNTDSQMELQDTVKNNLQKQIINLLTPVFGADKILAEVNVRLNFDKESTESIEFAPPANGTEGIVTSMSELTETIKDYDGSESVVGVDANGGGTTEYPATTDGNSTYEKVSKDVNMEVNQTKTMIDKAQGQIDELSVAIILDSTDGGQDYTSNVKDLVANAIGVSNDRITVEMLPFQSTTDTDVTSAFSQQQQLLATINNGNLLRTGILAVAFIVVALIVLMMIKALKKPPEPYLQAEDMDEARGINLMADEEIDLDMEPQQIDFDNKNEALSQLEEYIDKNPESVAMLLKSWLSDD